MRRREGYGAVNVMALFEIPGDHPGQGFVKFKLRVDFDALRGPVLKFVSPGAAERCLLVVVFSEAIKGFMVKVC